MTIKILLRLCLATLFLSATGYLPSSAHAQTFTVHQFLDFGEVLDMGNGGAGGNDRLRVNPDGSFVYDAEFIVITPPTPADVSFTGGPPNTNFTLSGANSFINGGLGERFRINRIRFSPASGTTDGAGNGQFFIGGRAVTRRGGSTGSYPDDTYIGTFDITITFIP